MEGAVPHCLKAVEGPGGNRAKGRRGPKTNTAAPDQDSFSRALADRNSGIFCAPPPQKEVQEGRTGATEHRSCSGLTFSSLTLENLFVPELLTETHECTHPARTLEPLARAPSLVRTGSQTFWPGCPLPRPLAAAPHWGYRPTYCNGVVGFSQGSPGLFLRLPGESWLTVREPPL